MGDAMKRSIFVSILVLLVSLAAFQNAQAVINGQLDGDDHPYVGAVLQIVNGEPFFCSGVAISPTLVLTSGHCIQDEDLPVGVNFLSSPTFPGGYPDEFHFGFGSVHEEFCLGCGRGLVRFITHDIAVIELEMPVALDEYAKLPGEGLVDLLPMRQRLTTVGYGLNQAVPTEIWNVKRYATDVELIAGNHKVSDQFIKTSSNRSKGKGKFCFGDSGGAMLLGDTLVALPSYGASKVCSSVGYSMRIDLDYVLEFIRSF
jgi:hypothetical protein